MSLARMKAEAEEAEKLLEGIGELEPTPEPTPEPEPELTPEPTPEPEPSNSALEELNNKYAALEHRFNTVQGMLKKANEELKILRDVKPEPKPEPKPELKLNDTDLFEDLKTDFGEKTAGSIIKLMELSSSALRAENAELRKLLSDTVDRTKNVEQGYIKTTEDRYWETLSNKHSDWEDLNGNDEMGVPQDPRFTKFLTQKVPGTGKTYDDLLLDSYNSLDAKRTAEIFDIFKEMHKASEPSKKKGLENFVNPDNTRKGSVAPKKDEEKKIYSRAEHDKLLMELKVGKFNGTRAERIALENELIDAELEGRIK